MDMFEKLVNRVEASLDTADDIRQQRGSSNHQAIGTENFGGLPNKDGRNLEDDEVHVTGTKAAEKRKLYNSGYKLPVNLYSGGRQNNFPVKFKHGRHIYYRISDLRFVILVCPVPKCRRTTFSMISDLLSHFIHDHFAYHNDVPIGNYEDALNAFGKEVQGIDEDRNVKIEIDEEGSTASGNTHRTLAIPNSRVDDYRAVIVPSEASQLHGSIEDSLETDIKAQRRKRRRIVSGSDKPTTGRKC